MIRANIYICIVGLLLVAGTSSASTVAYSTLGEIHAAGGYGYGPGAGATYTYGGFTAGASGSLESVSFYTNGAGPAYDDLTVTADLRVTLYSSVWDNGSALVGDVLESIIIEAPEGGYSEDGYNPSLVTGNSIVGTNLTMGEIYWLKFEVVPETGVAAAMFLKSNDEIFTTGMRAAEAGHLFSYSTGSERAIQMSVTVNTVPIPAAVWLFGSALAGLGWMRRKQTA